MGHGRGHTGRQVVAPSDPRYEARIAESFGNNLEKECVT